jgi:RNA polymerase sigma factor (sigma-70 family)
MNADVTLLRKYHDHGDALAFRELVAAHAGMVFATARRVTRDAALAEDVTQETFIELARNSDRVTESVGAWLHRVAWRRACNVIRNEVTRRRYEETGAESLHERDEAIWDEIEPHIDEVLNELPDKVRQSIVEHFLEGRTQQQVAVRLGVSQATVSRLLDCGISEVRSRLQRRQLFWGGGLGLLLATHSAPAASPNLVVALAKLAVSGLGSAAETPATAPTWRNTLGRLFRPSTIILLLAGLTFFFFLNRDSAVRPALNGTARVNPLQVAPPTSSGAQQWVGEILCQLCAPPVAQTRLGLLLHNENGATVIYHLRGAVPRIHETYCPQGQPGVAQVTGTPGQEAGIKVFTVEKIQPGP